MTKLVKIFSIILIWPSVHSLVCSRITSTMPTDTGGMDDSAQEWMTGRMTAPILVFIPRGSQSDRWSRRLILVIRHAEGWEGVAECTQFGGLCSHQNNKFLLGSSTSLPSPPPLPGSSLALNPQTLDLRMTSHCLYVITATSTSYCQWHAAPWHSNWYSESVYGVKWHCPLLLI